jgi:nitrate reductase delta subunit
MYAAAGLVLESDELPDHLPVMLGFAALAPPGYGEHVLQEHRLGIELLLLALRDTGRPHADVLEAVSAALPRLGISQTRAVRKLAAEGPPDEQVGLEPFAPPEIMPLEVRQ